MGDFDLKYSALRASRQEKGSPQSKTICHARLAVEK
jgi:hypothetical protein